MTDSIKINLPKLGESIVSATVIQWFKKVGDCVELDEPLLEVSTDKINSEIPSPAAGVLQEILAQPSQEVQVGEPLAILKLPAQTPTASTSEVSSCPSPSSSHEEIEPLRAEYFQKEGAEFETQSQPTALMPERSCSEKGDFLSPSVMRLLREKGLNLEEIGRIPRTGQNGRLTKKDVEAYLPVTVSPPPGDGTERIKMSSFRKAIADNMVRSFYEAPHASLFTEVDVTPLVKIIQEHKISFLQKHGAKLSITAFVARAIAKSLKSFPFLNASLEGETIVMKRFVNLGIAVSVDQGVVVPVIHGCHHLSLPAISRQIAEMAEKARTGRLSAIDTQEGTITMTNFGMTGTMVGVPIIRYPEVAIVGLGAITKKVAAMPDDSIAIRSMMWITLTFDHRVLDGLYGCGFLGEVKKNLEEDISLD